MLRRIQILHLEDDLKDTQIIEFTLKRAFPECVITLVRTKEDFEERLEEEAFDVILLDYLLPGYDGFEALQYAKKKAPQYASFIILTGYLNEKFRSDFLSNGAADYVIKGESDKLITAIRKAIDVPRFSLAPRWEGIF